ncbi:MAG: hypothetical protein QXW80_03115 [Candidatus Micrarchaeia archaeon]
MTTKWSEAFVTAGRAILAIIIAVVIGSTLKANKYFYKDNITPWLLGIVAGVLCFIMLQILSKGKG